MAALGLIALVASAYLGLSTFFIGYVTSLCCIYWLKERSDLNYIASLTDINAEEGSSQEDRQLKTKAAAKKQKRLNSVVEQFYYVVSLSASCYALLTTGSVLYAAGLLLYPVSIDIALRLESCWSFAVYIYFSSLRPFDPANAKEAKFLAIYQELCIQNQITHPPTLIYVELLGKLIELKKKTQNSGVFFRSVKRWLSSYSGAPSPFLGNKLMILSPWVDGSTGLDLTDEDIKTLLSQQLSQFKTHQPYKNQLGRVAFVLTTLLGLASSRILLGSVLIAVSGWLYRSLRSSDTLSDISASKMVSVSATKNLLTKQENYNRTALDEPENTLLVDLLSIGVPGDTTQYLCTTTEQKTQKTIINLFARNPSFTARQNVLDRYETETESATATTAARI